MGLASELRDTMRDTMDESAASNRRRLMQALERSGGSGELTDLARSPSLRGVHYASIEKAAASLVKSGSASMKGGVLTLRSQNEERIEEAGGGAAFSKAWRLWRKHKAQLLMLTTQLRVALEVIKKTPGYEIGRGKNRPGAVELESGLQHVIKGLRDLRVGFEKMSETTFLESAIGEDWDEDNDGLGMDDDVKRKKPTTVKDLEKETGSGDSDQDPESKQEARLLDRIDLMMESVSSTMDVKKANAMLAKAQSVAMGRLKKALGKRFDKVRAANIGMVAESSARKALRGGERWGGPANNTTYPAKHYKKLESMLGVMGAQELSFFDEVYDAWMRWFSNTGAR